MLGLWACVCRARGEVSPGSRGSAPRCRAKLSQKKTALLGPKGAGNLLALPQSHHHQGLAKLDPQTSQEGHVTRRETVGPDPGGGSRSPTGRLWGHREPLPSTWPGPQRPRRLCPSAPLAPSQWPGSHSGHCPLPRPHPQAVHAPWWCWAL